MPDYADSNEILALPNDLSAYTASYPTKVKDPIASEASRLLRIARKLGRRLHYALGEKLLGPEREARLPDPDTVKTFNEYTRCVLGLMREQRERIDTVLKYKLQPDFTEEQLKGKVLLIVADSLDAMEDDELEAALERRRIARASRGTDGG